jgi:hypothetical protein
MRGTMKHRAAFDRILEFAFYKSTVSLDVPDLTPFAHGLRDE